MDLLEQSYQEVEGTVERAAIESGRAPEDVTLVAVSKRQPLEKIIRLYDLGHRDFGENYAQELIEKAEALKASGRADARWHFIGHLQTNKVAMLISHLFSIHTVDREKLARVVNAKVNEPFPVFLEVNLDGETSKSGVIPPDALALKQYIEAECPQLLLKGLMCIPDPQKNLDGSAFDRMKNLREQMKWPNAQLSMGMSADFEEAILRGSQCVRVGTRIFGNRPT